MKDKKTYAGKIKNTGTQIVEAVFPQERGKSSKRVSGEALQKKGGKK